VGYLDTRAILSAAVSHGCDAIHPGYGLLSENADFAREVEAAGITLVGPTADLMARMGDKVAARQAVAGYGLKTIAASEGAVVDVDSAVAAAESIGYPVILKAVFGGGGRGMRVVAGPAAMPPAFAQAQSESVASFGRGELYVERYLETPRHIEVQVLGDGNGHAVQLGTRECSIQRHHQKLLEEAPAPFVEAHALSALGEACAAAAADLGYRSAGTFEFLYEHGDFYFIEMNTRIQVEHPVTEMITGIDLVKAQLEIAMSGELPFDQAGVDFRGHAIECRINAEKVSGDGFEPSPGLVYDYVAPGGPGVRVDSHLYNGYKVPHEYDSLIAKVIAWGRNRQEAIRRCMRALAEFQVRGIATNADLLERIVESTEFGEGAVDTTFLDTPGIRQ